MDKRQLSIFSGLTPVDTNDSSSESTRKFIGTDNPRYLRVIRATLLRPRSRKEIDRIAGAANGPEVIAELRRLGLTLPCERKPGIDRDGYPIKFGIYAFDDDDRRMLEEWQSRKQVSL